MLFRDRVTAGKILAHRLSDYADAPDLLVLGIPRGGVPVAYEVAQALSAPMDICLVRKLGAPGCRELAIGAIAAGGVRVLNQDLIASCHISPADIEIITLAEQRELARRSIAYRHNRPPLSIEGCTVILVDDGLATGASMHVAAIAIRQQQPKTIIAAVPVGAAEACSSDRLEVDAIICAETPHPFQAVGHWYQDFSQTTDTEVCRLLSMQ